MKILGSGKVVVGRGVGWEDAGTVSKEGFIGGGIAVVAILLAGAGEVVFI